MTGTTIETFLAEVGRAMSVAVAAPNELPNVMAEVDAMYGELVSQGHGEEVRTRIQEEEILVHLRQHPGLFGRFNFASSLLDKPQSRFYLAIIEGCRAQLPKLTQDELLKVIEACRRNKMYAEMDEAIATLETKLEKKDEFILRSKVLYEKHMAYYQQAMLVESVPDLYKTSLAQSLAFALSSAEYAKAGGDIVGALFALMNIGGLLMWRLGEWRAAILHSTDVCMQAKNQIQAAEDDTTSNRAYRVLMSTYIHRINIAAQFGGDVRSVEAWLARLQENPIFLSAKDQDWAVAAVRQAQNYIQSK